MIVTAREGKLDRPVFSSNEVTQLEVRDNDGYLVMFTRFLPDGNTILISKKGEEDFEWNAENHRIPMHVPPEVEGPATFPQIIIG